jgi:hypothetical protein
MSRTDAKRPAKSSNPLERGRQLALFGPPPLIEGEDTRAYDELLTQISTAVKPANIPEDIWVQDIVDLVWEALRLRRLKANPHDGHRSSRTGPTFGAVYVRVRRDRSRERLGDA